MPSKVNVVLSAEKEEGVPVNRNMNPTKIVWIMLVAFIPMWFAVLVVPTMLRAPTFFDIPPGPHHVQALVERFEEMRHRGHVTTLLLMGVSAVSWILTILIAIFPRPKRD